MPSTVRAQGVCVPGFDQEPDRQGCDPCQLDLRQVLCVREQHDGQDDHGRESRAEPVQVERAHDLYSSRTDTKLHHDALMSACSSASTADSRS